MTERRPPSRSLGRLPLVVGALVCLAPARAPAAIATTEWKYRQTVDVVEAGVTKITLPDATLDAAGPALTDLRLATPTGDEVPYIVEVPRPPEKTRQPPSALNVRLRDDTTEITITTGAPGPIEAIDFLTPARNFVKAARVETSADGATWALVGDGLPLGRQLGFESTTLPMPKTTAAYVRVTLDDRRTPVVPFTGAMLLLAGASKEESTPLALDIVKRDEFVHESVLTLDLHSRHLPLIGLDFNVAQPLFARQVRVTERNLVNGESLEHTVANGAISRMTGPERGTRENLRIPLDFSTSVRELQIHIANANDAPLTIAGVTAERRPVRLIFRAPVRGRYTLFTGNPTAAAPIYDLAQFAAELRGAPENPAAVSPLAPNPDYQRIDPLARIPLFGAPIDIAGWKFRKPVIPAFAGSQELELDPEVLAHAQREVGDLRLVRNGHQVPYLVERTSLLRSFDLAPVSADDAKRPRLSRWKFQLPIAGVPLARLTLNSRNPVFSRRVEIFEFTTDVRGEKIRRLLADPMTWNSTLDRPVPAATVALSIAPITDAIFVETDNGDNPPISVDTARGDYPVVRLLFRADADPLELIYGNDSASAPRYDLELVAQQLFNDEKSLAKLGAEETSDSASGRRAIFARLHGGVWLWSALALVVVVLLTVIARLLPKPPST